MTVQIYGDIIAAEPLLHCLKDALDEATQVIDSGNRGPMGTTARTYDTSTDWHEYQWYANASFGLIPTTRLTWPLWHLTLVTMLRPILSYERSFSFSIKCESTGDMEIGSGLMKLYRDRDVMTGQTIRMSNSR